MPAFRAADHQLVRSIRFDPAAPAEVVTSDILMSRGQSNSYLVVCESGDVVINTGTTWEGERHRERYEELLGRPLVVSKIIFTQSHQDHMGGWSAFAQDDTETIAQRMYPEGRLDRQRLIQYLLPRSQRTIGPLHPPERRRRSYLGTTELETLRLFEDSLSIEVGGRRFELCSLPGGETRDGLAVWLPDERAVFTGNLGGALYGQFPHLYTIRGDRPRSARAFVASINRVLALEADLLLTGHDEPIRGGETIRVDLTKLRDMTQYLHDETVNGMNDGKDLWTLMREIRLPAALEPASGRGPIRWYVRTVWEEYVGWFRMESTTELYNVPAHAMWPELAELAGGPEILAGRARAHLEAGRPVEALHLTDIALSVSPSHPAARETQVAALELLIERTGGAHFDELSWLEGELIAARRALGADV